MNEGRPTMQQLNSDEEREDQLSDEQAALDRWADDGGTVLPERD